MANAYLAKLRKDWKTAYDALTSLQTRAVTENRDLTADELTQIETHRATCERLRALIEPMAEFETRSAATAAMAVDLGQNADGAPATDPNVPAPTADPNAPAQLRQAGGNPATDNAPAGTGAGQDMRAVGAATTQSRDPGHYRKAGTSGVPRRSFFSDMFRASPATHDDDEARKRLAEHATHMRSLTSTGAGAGLVPPRWLSEEYDPLARQGRVVANAVRNIDLDGNPAPLTLPKQTAGTDNVVAQQAAENDPVSGTDAFATSVDVVTPTTLAGKQVVSRQMLDAGNPAADALIYADLLEVYNAKIEARVGAAILAAAGAPVKTFADEAAFRAQGAAWDAAVDIAIDLWDKRKMPGDFYTSGIKRWGEFKKLKDADGRPLIPPRSGGPVNIMGIGDVRSAGELDIMPYLPTDGISLTATYPQSVCVVKASDVILFEDALRRFRFEEQAGPESVVLGVWGYSAVIVRQVGKSVRRFVVTAA